MYVMFLYNFLKKTIFPHNISDKHNWKFNMNVTERDKISVSKQAFLTLVKLQSTMKMWEILFANFFNFKTIHIREAILKFQLTCFEQILTLTSTLPLSGTNSIFTSGSSESSLQGSDKSTSGSIKKSTRRLVLT